MKKRSWLLLSLLLLVLWVVVVSCGEEPQPAPTPVYITVVVTVTAEPEEIAKIEVIESPTATSLPEPTSTIQPTPLATDMPTPTSTVVPTPTAFDPPTLVPSATPTPTATATTLPTATATTTPAATATEEMEMSLSANRAIIEHSPRPEPFSTPESLDDIPAPPEGSWLVLNTGEVTEFRTYDGVRVRDEGEALLDLGDLMYLLLKRDAETQFISNTLVEEELAKIRVDFEDSPFLQRIVLGMHLRRGGFTGEKELGSDPIALTTPNAVIVVSGTKFFLVYDPDSQTTWVGNFDGTVDVTDIALEEGEALPDRQLVTIPAVRNRKYWPIHEHMTREEFIRLIDLQESPIAAVDMISGPYLFGLLDGGVAIRSGPGVEYGYIGSLAKGEYARIIGRSQGWWRIQCPQYASWMDCWVSGGPAYTAAYNSEGVPWIPPPSPPEPEEPTPIPEEPTPELEESSPPVGETPAEPTTGDVFDCDYIGNDKFSWYTAEGGPFTGIWQSGCPALPKISIKGCTVYWEAYNHNVVSARIGIHKVGKFSNGKSFDNYEETGASLPDGSLEISFPAPFEGEVTATFKMKMDNGSEDSKQARTTFTFGECFSGW